MAAPSTQQAKPAVLFVCLGNICRSTMAEGVFRSIVAKGPYRDLVGKIDSCGTSDYHVGSAPDRRTMATLRANGIDDYLHAGRQLKDSDFNDFDYVFAMDVYNLLDIQKVRARRDSGRRDAKVMLWGAFAEEDGSGSEVVDDPYYGRGAAAFATTYEQCVRFSTNFLRRLFPGVQV